MPSWAQLSVDGYLFCAQLGYYLPASWQPHDKFVILFHAPSWAGSSADAFPFFVAYFMPSWAKTIS